MSQKELAELADVSFRAIQNFETGKTWPNEVTRARLERLGLGWDVGHLSRLAARADEEAAHGGDADGDVPSRIRSLMSETEKHLLAGQWEVADAIYARASTLSREITRKRRQA